jgi:type I restriction enzyme R subunit
MEALFVRLPEFFKDKTSYALFENVPDTRKRLIEGLTERGFGRDQLVKMQKIIDAAYGRRAFRKGLQLYTAVLLIEHI